MKQKLLKTMLLLSALVVGLGNVWAEAETLVWTSGTYSSNTITWTYTWGTLVQSKSGVDNETNPSSSYTTSPRIYKYNNLTFTPATGYTITQVEMTGSSTNYNGQVMVASVGSVSTSENTTTWTGSVSNSSNLVLTMGKQFRPSSVVVTYTSPSSGSKSDLVIELDDTSGSTTYGTPKVVDYLLSDGSDFIDDYDGTMTYTIDNTAIASVSIGDDAITFTPKAVGTAVVTIKAPATASYNAADNVEYTLTVTAPEGGEDAAPTAKFTKVTSTEDVTDGKYLIVYEDGAVAFNGGLATLDAIENTISVSIDKTSSPYEIAANATTCAATFTWNKAAGTLKSASGLYMGRTGNSNGMNTNANTTYSNSISISSGNASITSSAGPLIMYNKSADQKRFRYYTAGSSQQAVQLYKYQGAGFVKLNSEGYATYCSEYPLDFSGPSDYTAWQITSVSGGTITFSKITGAIKGGQGILLMGTPNATITLTSTDSENVLSGNNLKGTTAPTYLTQVNGDYTNFGLSGDVFKKVASSGATVPANKAYLPVLTSEIGAEVKAFTFVFEDDADGISLTPALSEGEGEIYNLAGQRLSKMQKGINIVNGKKVLK